MSFDRIISHFVKTLLVFVAGGKTGALSYHYFQHPEAPIFEVTKGVLISVLPTNYESEACNIKGNISASGERIYHLPGQRYYSRTRISRSRGEKWFCSENEAREAGWRKSKR